MKIKDAQERTGITTKNIRYYEKEGLLSAGRDAGNQYRIYEEADIQRLMQIKLLRKLGISIHLIKLLFDGEIDLAVCLDLRKQEIAEEQERLKDMGELCEQMRSAKEELYALDAEYYLEKINCKEHTGGHFINVALDYMTMAMNITPTPAYHFEPNDPILKKADFTKELLIWSERTGKKLEILHEGMEPVVKIDGIKYMGMLEIPRILELKGIFRILPFFAAHTYGFKFVYLYPYQ